MFVVSVRKCACQLAGHGLSFLMPEANLLRLSDKPWRMVGARFAVRRGSTSQGKYVDVSQGAMPPISQGGPCAAIPPSWGNRVRVFALADLGCRMVQIAGVDACRQQARSLADSASITASATKSSAGKDKGIMKTRRSKWQGYLFSAALLLTTGDVLKGAIINVPAGGNIQTAIDGAAAGDTILVAPDTFLLTMSLNINKANLIVQSTGGAGVTRLELNDATMPVVKITAPGCTLNGFWIRQLDDGVQAGHSGGCVRIEPDGVSPPLGTGPTTMPTRPITTVQNCIISGDETGEGIVTYSAGSSALVYAHVRILNNQFVKHGAGMYSFQDAIHFHFSDPDGAGPIGNVSASDSLIEIFGNTVQQADRSAVYVHHNIVRTKMDMGDNVFTMAMGADYGVYFSGYVYNGSSFNIVNTSIANAGYGIYVDAEYGSSVQIIDCSITNFSDYGIYAYLYGNSHLLIDPTILSGNGTADYGIYLDMYYGCTATIDQVSIDNVDYAGIYASSVESGSTLDVTNNIIVGATNCDYGVYSYTEYGSHTNVSNNNISGFDYAGLYEDYPYAGSSYTAMNNRLIAPAATGADYGIYVYGPEYDSTADISGNTIQNFKGYGIYVDYIYYHGWLNISNNSLSALAGFGSYGIYVYEVYQNGWAQVMNNLVSSFDYAGFYSDYVYDDSSLIVDGNTFAASSTGADYGIYVDEVYDLSDATISNNTCTNFDDTGFYHYQTYYNSLLNVVNNVFTAVPMTGAIYGIYMDYPGYEGGIVTVSGNTVTNINDMMCYIYSIEYGAIVYLDNNSFSAVSDGCNTGLYIDDYIEYGSIFYMRNNTFTGFGNQGGGEAGVYHDSEVYEGSTWIMDNCHFISHEMGCEYGFYCDDGFDYGCVGIFTNSSFSGFTYAGWYSYYAEDGSFVTVDNCVFEGLAGGADYGMMFDDGAAYGSHITVTNNRVTRFMDAGIWCYELYDGSRGIFNNNVLIGEAGGARYGFYMDDAVEDGSYCEVIGNQISNIKYNGADAAGIYFDEYIYEGSVGIISNNIIRCASDPGGDSHGIWMYYVAEYGSKLSILNNDIEGHSGAGIYLNDDLSSGSQLYINDNRIVGGMYGIFTDGYGVEEGSKSEMARNSITGFTEVGIMHAYVDASDLTIRENNIVGGGTTDGIAFDDYIGAGSRVLIDGNCISNVPTGLLVDTILDSSQLKAINNDFSGVTTVGVDGGSATALNPVDARENFFGALATRAIGEVLTTPVLLAAPDSDGDGVPNCADACPGTPAGTEVDASGCPTTDDGTPPPPPPPPCGICGIGVGGMMPLSLLGLVWMRRKSRRRRVM